MEKRLRPEIALRQNLPGPGYRGDLSSALDPFRMTCLRSAGLKRPRLRKSADHPEARDSRANGSPDDLVERIAVMLDLGLGYLSLERSTPHAVTGRVTAATFSYSNPFEFFSASSMCWMSRPRDCIRQIPKAFAGGSRSAQGLRQTRYLWSNTNWM